MSDFPVTPALSPPKDFLNDSSRRGPTMSHSTKTSEDFAIYMGDLVPRVGRPIVIVTYQRHRIARGDRRRELAFYWAFFTHEAESFTSALCQRFYVHGAYPRLGAKTMVERTRDEGELALGAWLARPAETSESPSETRRPLALRTVDLETLFGLYVYSSDVRACMNEVLAASDHTTLCAALKRWSLELGINQVPLPTAAAT